MTDVSSSLPSTSSDTGEIVYDATQIEELEHFDIGEDDTSASIEIAADEVNAWPPGELPPSTVRGGNRGRGRGSQVVHIQNPRRLPNRQARVKSFKSLIDDHIRRSAEPEAEEQESEVVSARKDDAVSRIFVSSDDPVHHLGWSLYSRNPEPAAAAAFIILTDANMINPEQTCSTVPQEFTGVGTFIVNMSELRNRHEIGLDSLGSWGTPQGRSRLYKLNPSRSKAVLATESDYTMKVMCNRYIHPGTDSRGVFSKKIYTGISPRGEPSSFGVIVYEWQGTPHPVAVSLSYVPHAGSIRERAFGSKSWEAQDVDLLTDEGATYRGQPVFVRVAVDFETACRILLATFAIPEHRICVNVPHQFRECGTFVVDLARCGGERAIMKDGREWNKPSGSSRFFRFDADGRAIRVDSTIQAPHPEDYDVQVIAKRYETQQVIGLVRKVFIAREKDGPRVNSHLAVITYLYKPACNEKGFLVGGRLVENSRKRTLSQDEPIQMDQGALTDEREEMVTLPTSSNIVALKRMSLEKQLENQTRMESLLERAESILDKFEQTGTHAQIPLVRQLITEWNQGVNEEIVIGEEEVYEEA